MRTTRLALLFTAFALFVAAASPALACEGPFEAEGDWDATTSTCSGVTFVCEQGYDVLVTGLTHSGSSCTATYYCCTDPQPTRPKQRPFPSGNGVTLLLPDGSGTEGCVQLASTPGENGAAKNRL